MKKQGSVLLFSLLILSALVALSQQLIQNIFVGARFDATMINREKAELIALSGINVAIALLNEPFITKKHDIKEIETKTASPFMKQISSLLPLLNQWRTFPLTYDLDGIDGSLSLCITSEEGKIPLMQAYDLKTHTFKPPFDALIKKIPFSKKPKSLESKHNSQEKKDLIITDALITFFKQRNRPLDDISELYSIDLVTQLPLFYNPPFIVPTESKKKIKIPLAELALQDIFSLHNKQNQLHPLLLTDGVKALLEVGRVEQISFEKRKEIFKPFFEKYQEQWSNDWINNWKNLQLLHSQSPKSLGVFKDIFTTKFEPTTFSVLSSGIVNGIEQRICAIITKDTTYTTSNIEEKKEQTDKTYKTEKKERVAAKKPFKILSLYWV